MGWDTSVAINRMDKSNIVVSYIIINFNTATVYVCRAVSFDGGKTWPAPFDGTTSQPLNGLTNIQPTGVPSASGDNPGVRSDKFGNIWYLLTNFYDNFGNFINQPVFWISTDCGVTYSIAYTLSTPASGFNYDFPQFSFGGDGQGNYGIWFVADYINATTGDLVQPTGFIQITGPGVIGVITNATLTSLINTNSISNITASIDGRVWIQGLPNLNDGPT